MHLLHMDKNANRTWRMRIGHGGNPYSFMGPFGEALPPQKHAHAPWIDEVWQMVAVDNIKNTAEEPFFIHQAGTYQRESILRKKPFYSPNVASHCSKEHRSCAFVSWGQQAHVPTEFTSSMLYYTRYQDCGDGVVEVTWLMYNMGTAGGAQKDVWNYLNVPWGGVRTSTLADVVVETNGNSETLTPVGDWGKSGQVIRDLSSFGGYTAFVEGLPRKAKVVKLPEVDGSVGIPIALIKAAACHESASHTKSQGEFEAYRCSLCASSRLPWALAVYQVV